MDPLTWLFGFTDICNWAGAVLIIAGILVILALIAFSVVSERASGGTAAILLILGIGLILGGVFFGPQLTKWCNDTRGEKIGLKNFYIELIHEDNTSVRLPSPASQLIVYYEEGKALKGIKWHIEIDRNWLQKFVGKKPQTIKFWMYWNKPMTLGMNLWEKEVNVENNTIEYFMPYSELKEAVEKNAGSEIWSLVTGQAFDMDINVGAEITTPKEMQGKINYDHLLKLWVSYKEDQRDITITAFDVRYYTSQVIYTNSLTGENVAITPLGILTIFSSLLGLAVAILQLKGKEYRRRKRRR